MSGGSYYYLYARVEDFAHDMGDGTPARAAFRRHLQLVAKAMHDIEWVDSGDMGPGDELAAMQACIHPATTAEVAVDQIVRLIAALQAALPDEEGA